MELYSTNVTCAESENSGLQIITPICMVTDYRRFERNYRVSSDTCRNNTEKVKTVYDIEAIETTYLVYRIVLHNILPVVTGLRPYEFMHLGE